MHGQKDQPFFSIIIPAHNEERYISHTLERLGELLYPIDRYEVIVVENGSTDTTYAKARAFESANVRVLTYSEKGVSFARNRGLEAATPTADWILFLDADTYFLPGYLNELTEKLSNLDSRSVVGASVIRPDSAIATAKRWFAFYDFIHRLFKQAYTLMIVRHAAIGSTRFEEGRTWMEDQCFVTELRRKGNFFFLASDAVYTSTRRYDTDGWWRLMLWQTLIGVLPASLSKRFVYNPVR